MACIICLELCENGICLTGIEGGQFNVYDILFEYFAFCFQDSDVSKCGIVCRPCWITIESIHKFYLRIKNAHSHRNNYVTESIFDTKPNIFVDVKLERNDTENECSSSILNTKISNEVRPKRKYQKRITNSSSTELNSQSETEIGTRLNGQGKIFTCSVCDLKFLKQFILKRHMKTEHNALEYRCLDSKCYESFETKLELDEHMNKCHERVYCPQCNKSISRLYLPKHMHLFHNESKRVICHLCGRISSNPQAHKLHYEITHQDSSIKLQCDICKSWLSNRHSMRKHMQLVHIRQPVQCDICSRTFAHKNSLRQHVRNHDIEIRKKVKCLVCGKGFRDKNNLKQHSSMHENQEHRCSYCGRIYRSERSMKRHIRVEHADQVHNT